MSMSKKVVKGVLAAVGVLAGIGIIAGGVLTYQSIQANPEGNFPEVIASAFVESLFEGDSERIFRMMPEAFQEASLISTKALQGCESDEEALAYQGVFLNQYLTFLTERFGSDYSYIYEITDVEYFTPEELASLESQLHLMDTDYTVSKAGRVYVDVQITALNGTEGTVSMYVPVVRSGIIWSLGQYISNGCPDPSGFYASCFGDLMDGFATEGVFDADGNRMYYDEEGYLLEAQKDGTWTAVDAYGNVRYYDIEQNLITITGPDGGEPLDESTYQLYYLLKELEEGS